MASQTIDLIHIKGEMKVTMGDFIFRVCYCFLSIFFICLYGCTTQDYSSSNQFFDPQYPTPSIHEHSDTNETGRETGQFLKKREPYSIKDAADISGTTDAATPDTPVWSARSSAFPDTQDENLEVTDKKKSAYDENDGLAQGKASAGEAILDNPHEDLIISHGEQVSRTRDSVMPNPDEREIKQELATDRNRQSFEEQLESSSGRTYDKKKQILTAKLSDKILQEKPMETMSVLEEERNEPTPSSRLGRLSAAVTIMSRGRKMSPENVIIVLEPIDPLHLVERPPKTHIVEMKRKKYRPRYLHIQVHDTVVFRNADPFMHNAFSLVGLNKFDLGTYGKDTEPSHTFEHPGLVKVYCNIHPSMACFIRVSRSNYGYITDHRGLIQVDNLPAGDYELTAWDIRGNFNKRVEILPGETAVVGVQIDASKYRKRRHLNKLGKKYPKKSGDEFY